jgi:para-aminobenzoate synthetase component 1
VLFLVGHDFSNTADAVIERLRAIVGARPAAKEALKQDTTVVTGRATITSNLPAQRSEWKWNLSRADFCTAVQCVRGYIASGDVYQVNLSQRARCTYDGDSVALYQALRLGNPAPYGAYLDLGDWQLISTSPEQFLQKTGRQLETRPIKGTRPRGIDAEADLKNEAALRVSQKDRAELLMIVDLERNDLGRVAEFGSVQVEGLYQLERYARVIHQTARVKANLAEHKDVYDALAAIFPGGSITGAPKIRAMQIIEELEPTRRGAYCGSIGYIGFDGDAEFNIAIRSLHLKDGQLDYQVGGGIVWDSDPEDEYQETLDKARAIRETIDQLCQTSS